MKRPLILVLGLAVTVLVTGVLIMTLRQPSEPDTPALGSDSEFDIHGGGPVGAGPGLAAQSALTTMFSWQPKTDASPGVGLSRAKPWLSGQLLTDADTPPAAGVKPLPEWARWRRDGDVVIATANTTAIHTPTPGRALVTLTLTQSVLHRDGTTAPWRVLAIDATTAPTPLGWRLTDYRVTG